MKKYLLIFCLLIPQFIFAQLNYPTYSGPGVSTNADYGNKAIANGFLQSPNAAGMGVYGNTDISPFTGLPNISIPVFNVRNGDLSLSAELRYFAGGVKPDDHPGWVGQNWSLNIGGVVTRKVNGGLDEVYIPTNPSDKWLFAYWYKFAGLAPTNWDTQSYLSSYLAPDKNNLTMLNPDEFSFTLPNGKSGSFFKNHQGLWQVKSESPGNFSIDAQLIAPPTAPLSLYSAQRPNDSPQSIFVCIFSIVITDNDGTKYTFGNNINAIEFTRGPKQDGYNDIIANSWFLTKMESIKGNVITFRYERGPHQLIQGAGFALNLSYGITGGTKCNGSNYNFLNHSATMITPCYLAEINSPSFKVSFQKEISYEKGYDYNYDSYSAWNGFAYNDIGGILANGDSKDAAFAGFNGANLTGVNGNRFYKLKGIQLFDARSNYKENYAFYYNNDDVYGSERLFLQRFQKAITVVNDDVVENYNYDFQYNHPEQLPEYNTLRTDEWGYYNGNIYTIGETNPTNIMAQMTPDSAFMRTGILTKIIYPTKGYTTFEYEPNNYSSVIKRDGGVISYTSATGIGGGLRIKKITDYSLNSTPTYKQYFYEKEGTPTTSSGVLAGHKQIYINAIVGPDGGGHAEYISNNSLIDLNYTNGRDVVYSRVKEQLQDGSYTIYNYSNSDNPLFRDEAPVHVYADGITATNTEFGTLTKTFTPGYTYPFSAHTSRELERGKLLSKADYSSTGTLVRKQVNTYNDDPARFTSQFVKSYIYSAQGIVCTDAFGSVIGQVYERYIEPIKIYTYLPYLKSQEDTYYDVSGNLINTTTQNYTYDGTRRLLTEQSFTDSEGQLIKTQLKYPADKTTSDPTGVYTAMVSKNITSPVIEATNFRGTATPVQTSFSRTNYGVPFAAKPNLIVPLSIEKQSASTNPVEKLASYTYDQNNGNVLSETQEGGISTGYQWGYAGQYPIAKCVNAKETEFYTQNFEDATTVIGYGAHTGINYYVGDYPVSWTKPPSRAYKISYWYRLSGKWLYSEADYTGPSTTLALGDAIDDVRIYPADGLISTYTFDPFRGMTSETDPKGITITYEYDDYNRLKNIKDQDGNIIKNFCYNLKGDETGCAFNGLVVYNDAQTGSYKKKNCEAGYHSDTSYPYSVAADTYAGINKTDANAKAKAAMDILGQANANTLGTCVQNTIPISYGNFTYHNAGVSRLKFKNDAGAIVYDFTEAQLIAGQTILPGLYTAEITTYGTVYNPTTQNGWGNFDFSIGGSPSYHYLQNTNAGNGPYVYVLADMATATQIYLFINPDFF